ncbi:hypothetical protein [Reinekea sp. G2M2-21]|uniref:hypothetical protein n=1 Tax=Reinekea sp. G2M2-21 TaxID=2788942 RepID=UPI0018A93011|nr:hypothetical protein [Reinekea sp. G2M2-21]
MKSAIVRNTETGNMWEAMAVNALNLIPAKSRSIDSMPTIQQFFKIATESGHEDFLLRFPGYVGQESQIPEITRQQVELVFLKIMYLICPEINSEVAEKKAHSLCWES